MAFRPADWQLIYDRDEPVDRLALLSGGGADLVVMETALTSATPPAAPLLTPAELAALHDAGQRVVGYVSVAVTDHTRAYWQADGRDWATGPDDSGTPTADAPGWLAHGYGEINADGGGRAFLVDYADRAWQAIVIGQAEQIVAAGYHGVFLDDVGRYFQAASHSGSYDPAIARDMLRLVIRIHDAVTAIDPDAFVVLNGDPNLVGFTGNTGLDADAPLMRKFLRAFDAMLLENQFVNEDDPVPDANQNLMSDAAAWLGDTTTLLSIESGGAGFDPAVYLSFCADRGILPFLPADPLYRGTTGPVRMGTDGADRIVLHGESRVAAGLGGQDTLRGTAGDDQLFGHDGRDRLLGGDGADRIEGGKGNDGLQGGGGADVFLFRAGDGTDRVRDWTDGSDRLRILSGADDMADLTITADGGDLLVAFADVVIRLADTDAAGFGAADVLFGY